jgi:GTP-binding nuclear protein Ran
VLLLGSAGVGKTSFLKRHLLGTFETAHDRIQCLTPSHLTYLATPDVEVTPISIETNKGKLNLKVWENGSKKGPGGMGEAC